MKKNVLKYLISQSYKDRQLDEKMVQSISDSLTRKDLKEYIKALKNEEKKRSITVILPHKANQEEKKIFQNNFPDKEIIFLEDPSLIVGVKIIDKDNIYDLNLKSNLEDIKNYLSNNL